MKKKTIIIIILIILLIFIIVGGIFFYHKWRVDHAIIKVELQDDLNIEVYSKVKLKDLIKSINGKIEDNISIDTKKLGEKSITFYYVNEENLKVPYTFSINIVDTEAPYIGANTSYTLDLGYKGNFEESLFCGDNYDDNPKCKIEGVFDSNTVGSYPVKYIATDSSDNVNSRDILINIVDLNAGEEEDSVEEEEIEEQTTDFNQVVSTFKNDKTKIGIDVSEWQGDIDFEQVKKAGVEFVFIRVGIGIEKENGFTVDKKFKQNIEGFNKVGIPVGIYFYSYANNKKAAIKEAEWVVKKLKKYKVSLPIAFDWEDWPNYREYKLSFYHLTEMANAFIDTVEKNGYEGMLYSSKNYLENIWFETNHKVWLANYNFENTYQGKFKWWQVCNDGKVLGVNDNLVDIDVMY